ncbi:MAG: DUF4116 domain-containing protein [Fibromonadaceae bacterium]|jgi:hypothetical protein|nr:DUF4116 domain-containing protein [Fibromonadaceae bacterium]
MLYKNEMEMIKDFIRKLEELQNPDEKAQLCLEAVKNISFPYATPLQHVPKNLKTAEMCNIAVKQNGRAIMYVPEEFKTAEMCLEAVKYDGMVLFFVPENLKTVELCLEAIEQNEYAIKWVPETIREEVKKAAEIKPSKQEKGK